MSFDVSLLTQPFERRGYPARVERPLSPQQVGALTLFVFGMHDGIAAGAVGDVLPELPTLQLVSQSTTYVDGHTPQAELHFVDLAVAQSE
jgi:hypothetical protein